jgi:transglutaminase-like putative cysteine protease
MGKDALQLFDFVHDQIGMGLYYGSKKGAKGALAEKAGNDFDQASLLVALLRASGIPARYEYATVALTPRQALDITGFEDPAAAAEGLATVGYPSSASVGSDGRVSQVRMERAFVRAYVHYGNYRGT